MQKVRSKHLVGLGLMMAAVNAGKSSKCIMLYKNRHKELTSSGTDRENNNFLNVEGTRQGQLKNVMNFIFE